MSYPDTETLDAPAKEARPLALKIPPSQQMVLDIMVGKARNGVYSLTAGDIREALEQVHAPRRFDKGWVTGRLDELRARDLAGESGETRFNPLTRRESALWFVKAQQSRLCV